MKKLYISLVFVFFTFFTDAQHLNDANWVLGINPTLGTLVNFTKDTFIVKNFPKKNGLDGMSTSFSNDKGELLYYTNGCSIQNSKDNTILGGDNLLVGSVLNNYCYSGPGVTQMSVFLPFPNSDTLYYLYSTVDDNLTGDKLYLLTISKSKDAVIKKELILEEKMCNSANFIATKHNNGKDWWIVASQKEYEYYISLLLTQNGITQIIKKPFYKKPLFGFEYSGQVAFSPNGLYYARTGFKTDLHLFDFDRCTGLLTNERFIKIVKRQKDEIPTSVSFSPNSRFMYVSSQRILYQYDLEAFDIEKSKILIDTVETFYDDWWPFPINFYDHSNTLNGKIIISSASSVSYLHYINRPNEKGKACDLRQHSIKLTAVCQGLTSFPNYRLGASGFSCDRDTTKTTPKPTPLRLYPNPTDDLIYIESGTGSAISHIDIYDNIGRLVYRGDYKAAEKIELSTALLASGLYVLNMTLNDLQKVTQKVVVVH